jgi:hypothetical protein
MKCETVVNLASRKGPPPQKQQKAQNCRFHEGECGFLAQMPKPWKRLPGDPGSSQWLPEASRKVHTSYKSRQVSSGTPEHRLSTTSFSQKTLQLTMFSCDRTVVIRSGSLVATPSHRFPRAVWLLIARPSANTATDGVCRANPSKTRGFR